MLECLFVPNRWSSMSWMRKIREEVQVVIPQLYLEFGESYGIENLYD